jgi:hypothetical protein
MSMPKKPIDNAGTPRSYLSLLFHAVFPTAGVVRVMAQSAFRRAHYAGIDMSNFDKASSTPEPYNRGVPDPGQATTARPLFETTGDLNRFMELPSVATEYRRFNKQDFMVRFPTDFAKHGVKCAAPVQSDKNGWENYLSRRELKDYDRARANMNRGTAAAIGLFLAKTGAMLFLTASVAPAFSLVLGTAAAIGGAFGLASWAKAARIQKRGERREAEAEVSAQHAKTPQGPRV